MLDPQHEQTLEYELSICSARKRDYTSTNCKDFKKTSLLTANLNM